MLDRLSRFRRQSTGWQRGALLLIAALVLVDVGLFLYGTGDGSSQLWTGSDGTKTQQTSKAAGGASSTRSENGRDDAVHII